MADARYASTNSIVYAIERKVAFIATFLSNDPSDFSFTDLRSRITSSRGTPTTLKLSQSKLAWGEKNPNRSTSAAMVPYASVQLGLVKELFTEVDHPSVLLCVIRATNKQGFRYEILAFRLHSEHDVQLFVNLFPKLTQQHQTPVGTQSRSTSFNRDERSYSPPPMSIRTTRPASTKLHATMSVPFSSSSSVGTHGPMSPPSSQMDGQAFRGVANGTFRRNHQNDDDFTADSSPHISGDRYSSGNSRAYEIQPPRNVNSTGTRPEPSMRSQPGRAIDRTFTTRNVGVMADLDSSIPRSRPGDYLPLDGELSSQHDRMYIYADGSKMGDVFCQTNLRSPLRSASSRHGSSFVYGNGQSDHTAGTRMTGTSGLSHRPNIISQQFADESDEIDSAGGYEQRNARSMQRRMTLVDNGVVKVTVEEYQDPAGKKTEEPFPDGQSSDQTIDEPDAHLDRLEISGRHVNRIEPVSGSRDRSSRSNSVGRHRSRQPMTSHESSASVMRTPTMTSSVQRVFRRRSVPRTSSTETHTLLSPPPVDGVRQKGSRRRSSYRGPDPVDDRPYTRAMNPHDDVRHQSSQRPVPIIYEPSTYSTHSRPYTAHESIHQSQPIILRREPMNSEKKRHHQVHPSHHQAYETVYQSQPAITAIRAEPTTNPVRHRSSAHESFYQSQPVITRNEPINHPVRQHRSSTRESSVYNSQPIIIRADPTISPTRQHRSTTQESVYQSRPPNQMRQKPVNYSDYGHDERIDVYREPRSEYRLVTGSTPGGSVIVRQSKRRTTP